jgi:hypothetical protein
VPLLAIPPPATPTVTGGRNGYGAKLANIFSSQFVVETNDTTRGLRYRQVFRNNMSVKEEPVITKAASKGDYTCITFTPDLARFKMDRLDDDIVGLMMKRVYDMAGISDKSLKVYLNDERLPIASFKDYVALYQVGARCCCAVAAELLLCSHPHCLDCLISLTVYPHLLPCFLASLHAASLGPHSRWSLTTACRPYCTSASMPGGRLPLASVTGSSSRCPL